MQTGRSVDGGWQGTLAEAMKLFVLPPLVTLAVVALSLLLFTDHLSRKDQVTTFVVEGARHTNSPALGHD